MLFHVFWLPHSHGPKAEMLVNEFKYLRDQAHLVLACAFEPATSSDDEEDEEEDNDMSDAHGNSSVVDAPEQEMFDTWMERASSFNNVSKRY